MNGSKARARVDSSAVSTLSEGHFPGEPILPGSHLAGLIVELAIALRSVTSGERASVRRLTRCRFTGFVLGNDSLDLHVQAGVADTFVGQAFVRGEVVATVDGNFG